MRPEVSRKVTGEVELDVGSASAWRVQARRVDVAVQNFNNSIPAPSCLSSSSFQGRATALSFFLDDY